MSEEEIEEKVVEEEVNEIEQMREQARLSEEKYMRAIADNENRTKRMQKEKQEMMRFAVTNAITEFLPILDNFDKALGFKDQMSDEVKNWAMGFEMILTQLKDVVAGHGFRPFSAEGMFDPHRHEAIEIEETDEYPDGTILQEFQRGYACHERIVMPAKVKVAKKPTKQEEPKETEEEEENEQ